MASDKNYLSNYKNSPQSTLEEVKGNNSEEKGERFFRKLSLTIFLLFALLPSARKKRIRNLRLFWPPTATVG
jgi:hypothetical protein